MTFDNIKIIMATTEGECVKILNAIKNGADGYIIKPFNPTSFINSISKFLEQEG
jgi:DNA-binding response OmpR family regulator